MKRGFYFFVAIITGALFVIAVVQPFLDGLMGRGIWSTIVACAYGLSLGLMIGDLSKIREE